MPSSVPAAIRLLLLSEDSDLIEQVSRLLHDRFPDLQQSTAPALTADAKLFLPTRNGFQAISADRIQYIESEGSYSRICTDKEEILISKNMAYTEQLLTRFHTFIRVHRSFIVNRSKIEQLIKGNPPQLALESGRRIPVSRKTWDSLLRQLHIL